MNKIYDNGGLMLGNIDLVIMELEKEIKENIDMYDTSQEELLMDLKDLKVKIPSVEIVCVNYDTGMGYSFDYWRKNDEIKEL